MNDTISESLFLERGLSYEQRTRARASCQVEDRSELETKFAWDRRIFQERSQSLTYVCEVPQLLEQRLGELARLIQARL